MYVKDLFCSTCIVLTQLCEEGHASCTLKTSFVVRALFLPNCVRGSCVMYVKDLFCSTCIVLTQLCEEGHASCTLKTSFVVRALFLPNCVKRVMRHVR